MRSFTVRERHGPRGGVRSTAGARGASGGAPIGASVVGGEAGEAGRSLQAPSRGKLDQPRLSVDLMYSLSGDDDLNKPKTERMKKRRRKFIALGVLVAGMLLVVFGRLVGHMNAATLIAAVGGVVYALWNEFYRLKALNHQLVQLSLKCRRLMEARRAAGLLRLEQDLHGRRKGWSAPPVSGFVAALKSGAPPPRCDYRHLAVECFAKLESLGLAAKRRGDAAAASDLRQWTLRLLKQGGLDPGLDVELYQRLHACLDEVDRADASSMAYHCRLCLGWQSRGDRGSSASAPATMNKCGHRICPECARGLLDDALRGHVPIPVTCPVGCAGEGREVSGNGQVGTLHPSQARHLMAEEPYERFKRLYDVKVSLAQSAPHSRSSELQKSLREAQELIAKSREAAKLH